MENKKQETLTKTVKAKPDVPVYDNSVREVKYKNKLQYQALNLKPENLKDLAEMLNSNEGKHIKEVYFCEDGNYYFKKRELDGKMYTRITERKFYDNDSQELVETEFTIEPMTEIVLTKKAIDIIDEYYDWRFEQDEIEKKEKQLLEDAKFLVLENKRAKK